LVTTTALVAGVLVATVPAPASAVAPVTSAYERSSLLQDGDAYGLASGDLTGDGRSDLVVTVRDAADPAVDYSVLVYARQVDGSLAADPTIHPISVASPTPASLLIPAIGDLDTDGDLDLAVGHEQGIDIFRQTAGILQAPTTLLPLGATDPVDPVHEVEVADVTQDGRVDLLYTVERGDAFRLVRRAQKSDGTFAGYLHLYPDVKGDSFAVGDVTGDARLDVVVEGPGDGRIYVHNPNSSELPPNWFTVVTDARIQDPVAVSIDDVTGDSRSDLVFARADGLSVMAANGDGTLADPVAVDGALAGVVAMETADLNGDTFTDAVAFAAAGTHVFLQDDAGNLGATACAFASVVPSPAGGNENVLLADLDADAVPEIFGAQDGPTLRRLDARTPDGSIASAVSTQATALVEVGSDAIVEGWVSLPGGHCGDLGQAHLERTLPGGSPEVIGSVDLTVDPTDVTHATFSFADVTTVIGDTTYRVLFDGDAFHAGSEGDPVIVEVTKRSSSLSLETSASAIVAGASATLRATLTGGDRPATITFSSVLDGVRTAVGAADVDDAGVASLTVSPAVTTTYIATYAATPTARGAKSGTVTIEVAKRLASLTLSAPAWINFGKRATLTADLNAGSTSKKVSFFRVVDGVKTLLGRVDTGTGGIATFQVAPGRNTKYVATFAGDATWSSATSATRTVRVRVVTTGRMVHFGHKTDGVAYYVCCRAYFAFEVAPNHAGDKVLVESQYLDGSTWKTFDGSSRSFTLQADSTQEIFTDIAGGKGFKFRIRACMATHPDHDGDCSAWVFFRFE
jgi:hypothetical protein